MPPIRDWKQLDRQETVAVLGKLDNHPDAVIFSNTTTEICIRDLTFYKTYKLYRLINYATMPIFTLYYLSNGEDFIQLDGTANPIYDANEKDGLKMDETTIIPYLDFFFAQVQGSEGDVFLVRNPRKLDAMGSLSKDQQEKIINSFKPMEVSVEGNSTLLTGTIFYGGGLISATVAVSPDGKLTFKDQKMLLTNVPFPIAPREERMLTEG